ncbi:MAG: thioredoxin domain-containing protein, partial [Leucobacter sp.]
MATETNERPTKNERRQLAREQARLAREQEKRREKRNRLFVQGGIVVGLLAILAVVALILTQTMKPAGPGPQNMATGGVVFTKDLKVVTGPALQPGEEREAPVVDREQLPLDMTVYVDYMCPACGNFEQQYGSMLENYVGSGDVELRVYPINFLDGQSLGTKYSTRAANMFSCIVEEQPDVAFELHNLLLSAEVQPEENTTGLTDDQLLEQAKAAGADLTTELKQCVKDQRFASFISANYKSVSETGVLGLSKGAQMYDRDGGLQSADGP